MIGFTVGLLVAVTCANAKEYSDTFVNVKRMDDLPPQYIEEEDGRRRCRRDDMIDDGYMMHCGPH